MEIKWVGLLTVAFRNKKGGIDNGVVLNNIEIGIGDDGTMRWRDSNELLEANIEGYENKIEIIDENIPSEISPDVKTKN